MTEVTKMTITVNINMKRKSIVCISQDIVVTNGVVMISCEPRDVAVGGDRGYRNVAGHGDDG